MKIDFFDFRVFWWHLHEQNGEKLGTIERVQKLFYLFRLYCIFQPLRQFQIFCHISWYLFTCKLNQKHKKTFWRNENQKTWILSIRYSAHDGNFKCFYKASQRFCPFFWLYSKPLYLRKFNQCSFSKVIFPWSWLVRILPIRKSSKYLKERQKIESIVMKSGKYSGWDTIKLDGSLLLTSAGWNRVIWLFCQKLSEVSCSVCTKTENSPIEGYLLTSSIWKFNRMNQYKVLIRLLQNFPDTMLFRFLLP